MAACPSSIFPVEGDRCLVTMVLGTAGLQPDEGIIGRPGHARKTQAICAWLNKKYGHGELVAWAKQDPARIDQTVPPNVVKQFSAYESAFARYGKEIYAIFAPNDDEAATRDAVSSIRRPAVRRTAREGRKRRASQLRCSCKSNGASHLTPRLLRMT